MDENKEFEPINTQEEFEQRVKDVYGDVTDLQGKINTLTTTCDTNATTIAALQAQVDEYQLADARRRVAQQKGLPPELADRLRGATEQELATDADSLAGTLRSIKGPAPLFSPDNRASSTESALMELVRNLKD